MRRIRGCDAPLDLSQGEYSWASPCLCGGNLPDCGDCGGEGMRYWTQCPSAIMASDDGSVSSALRAYVQFDDRHVMPAAGGWCDQSPHFQSAVETVDRARGLWQALKDKKGDGPG